MDSFEHRSVGRWGGRIEMSTPCELVATRDDIADRVKVLAADIASTYADKRPVLIGVLPGAIVFLADLARALHIDTDIDFLGLRPYSIEGRVSLNLDTANPLTGRDVILVHDVVDTGLTLRTLQRAVAQREPASLESCVFVNKERRRIVEVPIRYSAYSAADELVVGYGIGWQGRFANAPDLWAVTDVETLLNDPAGLDAAIYGDVSLKR